MEPEGVYHINGRTSLDHILNLLNPVHTRHLSIRSSQTLASHQHLVIHSCLFRTCVIYYYIYILVSLIFSPDDTVIVACKVGGVSH